MKRIMYLSILLPFIASLAMGQSSKSVLSQIEASVIRHEIATCWNVDEITKLNGGTIAARLLFDEAGKYSGISLVDRNAALTDPVYRTVGQSLIRTFTNCKHIKAPERLRGQQVEVVITMSSEDFPNLPTDTDVNHYDQSRINDPSKKPALQVSHALTNGDISPGFYCFGIFSSARLIANLTLMARAENAPSSEIETIKNNEERFSEVEEAFKAILASYAMSQSIDPRYAFRGEGRFYQCGFDGEKSDLSTLTRSSNDCAGTLRRLAEQASVKVNLPTPPSPQKKIDVESLCSAQKGFKLASIIPAGWEAGKKIDAIPPQFVGKWTLQRFPDCQKMGFDISADSVEGGRFSAIYEKNGSILLIRDLPPYRTSSLFSIAPDGTLNRQIWREEPDAWPEPQKPWTMKSEPMMRCR
ncbi:hypothetical protein [Azospirillum isscasi]|uniref:TonB C-terminal domain-containing protein n=1 Tax=Azospirillum isscasi TaxID=3053926 RepID=A0ABU0WGW2_9PROT|nr:hypothetical protein [Azospirillum isscasi]MDQ2103437.1 hypothetical protein [Azospirillum isscasi]